MQNERSNNERYIKIFGKGKKERLVPFSREAKEVMIEYGKNLRKELLNQSIGAIISYKAPIGILKFKILDINYE